MGVNNAFWHARCPAAVHDVERIFVNDADSPGFAVPGGPCYLSIKSVAGHVGLVGQYPAVGLNGAKVCPDGIKFVDKLATGDHHDRVGVLKQGFHGTGPEQRTQWHHHGTDFGNGPVGFQQFHAVGKNCSHFVPFSDTHLQHCIGQVVDVSIVFPPRQAAVFENHCRMIRPIPAMP